MTEPAIFAALAATLLVAAVRVVVSRHLVRSVLWLGVALIVTAVLFVLLRAPFLAGIQILLYTGGVITLMLFGVMLTRRHENLAAENHSSRRALGAVTAVGLFTVMSVAILQTDPAALPSARGEMVPTEAIAGAFLGEHLLAFEVLSVLLLAVMLGAIVLGRKQDYGTESQRPQAATAPTTGRKHEGQTS